MPGRVWWWRECFNLSHLKVMCTTMICKLSGTHFKVEPIGSGEGKVADSILGAPYSEATFRYLLKSEFHRSQRSGLAHYLLLLYQVTPEGRITSIPARVIGSVESVLCRCLRETDYIGWYRDGRVMGGVLTAMGKESGAEQIESLRARIIDSLRNELGDKEGGGLQVQICSSDEWASGGVRELDCAMDN